MSLSERDRLLLYESGELSAAERRYFETLLEARADLRAELSELRRQQALVACLSDTRPTRDLVAPALSAATRRRRLRFLLPVAAAAGLLLAIGVAVFLRSGGRAAPMPRCAPSGREIAARLALVRTRLGPVSRVAKRATAQAATFGVSTPPNRVTASATQRLRLVRRRTARLRQALAPRAPAKKHDDGTREQSIRETQERRFA